MSDLSGLFLLYAPRSARRAFRFPRCCQQPCLSDLVGSHLALSASTLLGSERISSSGGPAVTSSHLVFTVEAPGADRAAVEKAAENAKAGCPISKLLNTKITMEAKYET